MGTLSCSGKPMPPGVWEAPRTQSCRKSSLQGMVDELIGPLHHQPSALLLSLKAGDGKVTENPKP